MVITGELGVGIVIVIEVSGPISSGTSASCDTEPLGLRVKIQEREDGTALVKLVNHKERHRHGTHKYVLFAHP